LKEKLASQQLLIMLQKSLLNLRSSKKLKKLFKMKSLNRKQRIINKQIVKYNKKNSWKILQLRFHKKKTRKLSLKIKI
jgi:hypothetical protein